MIYDLILSEYILFLGTCTDIVDHKGLSVAIETVGADTDMIKVATGQFPDNDISGLKCTLDAIPSGCKVSLDVFDPSVIDVGIESVG
jgi:hypothetical protein